jgi:putative peptidoglycan lipid II flippase
VVGIALGVVLLPMLSRRVKEGDEKGARHALNRALELSAFLTLPAAAALIVMAAPLCDALFRGLASDALSLFGGRSSAFTANDVAMTGAALAWYGAGLPAFVWHKVFSPAFFAREDTKTPMNNALIAIAINTVAALALFPIFGFLAVAFATSFASWVQIGLLAYSLARRGHFKPDARFWSRTARTLVATAAMSACLWHALGQAPALADLLFGRQWIAIVAISAAGALVYFGSALALGAIRPSDYKAYARRRPPSP